jgi:DNA-binding MarR family transcriptional regulator
MRDMATRSKLVLDEFLPYRLSMAANVVSETVASAYQSAFGLAVPEWRLIAVIAEANAISQFEICRRTRMDKVTVSRAAILLAGRGLLLRTPNPNDQRSHVLALTKQGRKLYQRIAPRALDIEARIFGGFSASEMRSFVSMLARIDAAALAIERSPGSSKSIALDA